MIEPLITVYIVNYNYEKYLTKSILSVLCQSYQNFELIIIDDGSKDKSKNIIDSFNHNKITKKIFNSNIGLNRSNNVALRNAKGTYIIRLDADDYFHKNALKKFVEHINENKKSCLIYPDYYVINEKGIKLSRVKRENFLNNVKMLDLPAHGACTMFKTSILKKIGGYDENFNCQDGYDIWLKIIHNYKISNINHPLFFYRQHGSNLTRDEFKILSTRAKIKEKRVKKLKLNKKDTLAIIPVREASFDKNLTPFTKINKKTLIDTAVSYAMKSNYISKIIISTDSIKVKKYFEKKKIIVERRNDTDADNLSEVIHDILKNKIYRKYKNILLIFIEYPFRTELYLDKAINSLRLFNADLIECVRPENRMIYYHDGKGLKLLKSNKFLKAERDNIYIRTGGLIALKTSQFVINKKIYYKKCKIGHIIIDKKSSFSIKSKLDLKIAKNYAN